MELAQRARRAYNGNGGPRFGAFGGTLRCHCTVRKIALRFLTPPVPLLRSSLRPDLHPKSTNRLEIGGEFWRLAGRTASPRWNADFTGCRDAYIQRGRVPVEQDGDRVVVSQTKDVLVSRLAATTSIEGQLALADEAKRWARRK